MYLVELKPGTQAIYSSISDFSDAIRRGEVGRQARIYHRTKSQWAPITVHPIFRRLTAVAERASPALRTHWTFLPPEPGTEARAAVETAPEGQDPGSNGHQPKTARRWRGILRGLFGRRPG